MDSWIKRGQSVGIEIVGGVGERSKMNGKPVRTFLCVRIGIDDGDRLRDGMWEKISHPADYR